MGHIPMIDKYDDYPGYRMSYHNAVDSNTRCKAHIKRGETMSELKEITESKDLTAEGKIELLTEAYRRKFQRDCESCRKQIGQEIREKLEKLAGICEFGDECEKDCSENMLTQYCEQWQSFWQQYKGG